MASLMVWSLMALPPASAENALANDTQDSDAHEMHTLLVTARKWPEPRRNVPGAATIQDSAQLLQTGSQTLRDAALYVPNLTLGNFSVRRLTFPYIRGIGSGRNSPAVITYIDGVPQLSYATASQEFLSVERVEFLRGAQGAIHGQNALGGAINVVPMLPTRTPAGFVALSGGDHASREIRFEVNTPLGDESAAARLAAGYAARDGYTRNLVNDSFLDGREALFGFGQIYWPEQGPWSFRLSMGFERNRDGDYTLYDLAALRRRSGQVSRDFEGFSNRDILQPVLTVERHGDWVDFTSISAFQAWNSRGVTDMDMSAHDLLRRGNRESQRAWIEELRLSSPPDAPVPLGERMALRWLVGLFAYSSAYTQNAYTDFRPMGVAVLFPPSTPPNRQYNEADLDNLGASLFGQSALILDERFELGAGVRANLERRAATIRGYTAPPILPSTYGEDDKTFRHLSPQFSLSYRPADELLAYAKATRGFKAGGFNAQAPAGKASYDEESSWTYETGLKTAWMANRIEADVVVFHTAWDRIQLDVPAGLPNVYYIDNAGKATSRGLEMEFKARPMRALTFFGGVGLLDTRFGSGSASGGADIGGNDLPFAPHTTWHGGAEVTQPLSDGVRGFLRTEAVGTGRYVYDAIGGADQGPYTLVNMRAGIVCQAWRVEFWVRNLFDRDYVPLAFPFPLAPSGYVGEPGAPRTMGVSVTRKF